MYGEKFKIILMFARQKIITIINKKIYTVRTTKNIREIYRQLF